MKNLAVVTENAPAPVGPYSQAVMAGDFVFVSGQLGMDPKTGQLAGDIGAQTRQTLENLSAVLITAGAGPADVVKVEVFLADMGDFAAVNRIYAEYFTVMPFPARQAVESAHLPKGALIEISCIARKSNG
jgi:2-iminobutanoate/2-iminopropanoate deaminase